MPNGDDAVIAGMDKVLGTEDRRQGYDEINLTRDYVAGGPNNWTPGLTLDPTKATAARAALDVKQAGATVGTNGAYSIELIWDGVNLQLFVGGSFAGFVDLSGPGAGSWS